MRLRLFYATNVPQVHEETVAVQGGAVTDDWREASDSVVCWKRSKELSRECPGTVDRL